MTEHHIATIGRVRAAYHTDETVRLFFAGEPLACWTETPSLADACAAMFQPELSDMDADELRFAFDLALSADDLISHAIHDLARYGEIGVTL